MRKDVTQVVSYHLQLTYPRLSLQAEQSNPEYVHGLWIASAKDLAKTNIYCGMVFWVWYYCVTVKLITFVTPMLLVT